MSRDRDFDVYKSFLMDTYYVPRWLGDYRTSADILRMLRGGLLGIRSSPQLSAALCKGLTKSQ